MNGDRGDDSPSGTRSAALKFFGHMDDERRGLPYQSSIIAHADPVELDPGRTATSERPDRAKPPRLTTPEATPEAKIDAQIETKPETKPEATFDAITNGEIDAELDVEITTEIIAEAAARIDENELRGALDARQFYLAYQPQIELATGRLIGFEALLRWRLPDGRLVSPARFVPMLEKLDLIHEVGAWVLEAASAQAVAWQQAGLTGFRMSVNLSPRQFARADLVDRVTSVLDRTGMPARTLVLEITEGLLMEDTVRSTRALACLRDMGVGVAIDDFGTGYSSLGYLRRFPVDTLKIDHCFIPDMVSDPDVASIVHTILSLGQSLRLEVVAEGIETEAQLALLRRMGCNAVQGFLLGRPVPAPEIEPWLHSHALWCQEHPQVFGGPGERNADTGSLPGRTILVVEDDPEDRQELARMLGERGMNVIAAAGFGEALAVLESRASAITRVLTDISLPDGTGLELLRQARHMQHAPSFIIMTGHGTMEHAITALKEGAADFLTKPFSSRELDEALDRALRQSRPAIVLPRRL